MTANDPIEIRSYRSVFDLERRIYRIDQMRLNPGGVPIRGVAYCVVLELCVLAFGALPGVRDLLAILPWYLRYVALPLAGSALLTVVRVEGRPFHVAGMALVRYALSARHLNGLQPCRGARMGARWYPQDLVVVPDGSDARLRRLRFTGPGAALVTVAHERAVLGAVGGRRAPRLTLRGLAGEGLLARAQVVELARGVRMDVHPGR
jgi:hypothetical protein